MDRVLLCSVVQLERTELSDGEKGEDTAEGNRGEDMAEGDRGEEHQWSVGAARNTADTTAIAENSPPARLLRLIFVHTSGGVGGVQVVLPIDLSFTE